MRKLTITRGLPGSGKTTWAKAQQGAWRVNRDDLRAMHNGVWDFEAQANESLITRTQLELIRLLLDRNLHVIVDDTNLDWQHVDRLIRVARDIGSDVEVAVKEFLHVPLGVCIERDADRPNPVGRDVIEAMHFKYLGDADG